MNRDQALKIIVELLNKLHLSAGETYAANEAFRWVEEATAPKDPPKSD